MAFTPTTAAAKTSNGRREGFTASAPTHLLKVKTGDGEPEVLTGLWPKKTKDGKKRFLGGKNKDLNTIFTVWEAYKEKPATVTCHVPNSGEYVRLCELKTAQTKAGEDFQVGEYQDEEGVKHVLYVFKSRPKD